MCNAQSKERVKHRHIMKLTKYIAKPVNGAKNTQLFKNKQNF